jgi:adenylate cyclase
VSQVERTGAVLVRPAYLAMLAAVDVLEGDRKSATARVEEAFKEMERSGELFQQVPLLIGKSNLLAGGKPSRAAAHAAETCLRQALEVARAQGIRLLELRAAVALYRHCRGRGRAAEAREPLAAAYAWFANRQATAPEVLVARQLLAEPRD